MSTPTVATTTPPPLQAAAALLPPETVIRKTESILMIVTFCCHFIVAVCALNLVINDERDSAVATQSAWDMFDSSGAGAQISALSSSAVPFAWEATADALIDVARVTMPKFFGGALQDNASTYNAASAATLGNDQIRPLHVVANSLRLVQHRTLAPRMCENDVLTAVGRSYFLFDSPSLSAACPGFSSGARSARSALRCCIRDFDATELSREAEESRFAAAANASTVFRRVEAESSVLFSGAGVASALRPDAIMYPFTGFSLDLRYASDLRTVQLSSDGVPLLNAQTRLASAEVDAIVRSFVDPLTRYVRLSLLTIYWAAAVCVHLHVHIELPATGAAVVSWRKASTVPLRPGLFGSQSSTIAGSTSAAVFDSSYNSGLVVAEVFALFCIIAELACLGIRYKRFFRRDPRVPLWTNARLLLDVATALAMLVFFILRLVVGAQLSQFADALKTANSYDGAPVSRATDFVSGSWTRFIDSLRGGTAVMAFLIAAIFAVRYAGVVFQTIRRVVNAKTITGAADIAEDERNGASSVELLPAVLRRFFVDAVRLLTWATGPFFLLCAMALSVLRGPNEFAWSYTGSALGTLMRDRVLNLFGGFVVSRSKGANSYWESPQSGVYWADLVVGTVIEVLVPLVFLAGLVFVALRSQQEDVLHGKGKCAYFHHEDEEEARIVQMQLFPRAMAGAMGEAGLGPKPAGAGGSLLGSLWSKKPAPVDAADTPAPGGDEEMTSKGAEAQPLAEPLLKESGEGEAAAASSGGAAIPIAPVRSGGTAGTLGCTTLELQNDLTRRKLIVQLRQLSEQLRRRLGLVPPARVEEDQRRRALQLQQQQQQQQPQDGAAGALRKSVSWADQSPPQRRRGDSVLGASSSYEAAVMPDASAEERDPFLHVPTQRDLAREAAIERLLRARKQAEARGKTLTAEQELAALRGPLQRNVQDAIERIAQLYEDLTTLLAAGKSIRDALVADTKKTVDELEEALAKADEKKQREIDELNRQKQEKSAAVAATKKEDAALRGEAEKIVVGDDDILVVPPQPAQKPPEAPKTPDAPKPSEAAAPQPPVPAPVQPAAVASTAPAPPVTMSAGLNLAGLLSMEDTRDL